MYVCVRMYVCMYAYILVLYTRTYKDVYMYAFYVLMYICIYIHGHINIFLNPTLFLSPPPKTYTHTHTRAHDIHAYTHTYLCIDVCGIDLSEALMRKMEKNARKYPVPSQNFIIRFFSPVLLATKHTSTSTSTTRPLTLAAFFVVTAFLFFAALK